MTLFNRILIPKFTFLGLLSLWSAVGGAWLCSERSLQKGQVIKQFFAYSITESLRRNFDIFATNLPCIPNRTWAEEPPVFHALAVFFDSLGLTSPAAVPLFAYFLIGLGALLWFKRFTDPLLSFLTLFFCMSAPAFTKYSIEHLPDLLATSLLFLGALFLSKEKKKFAVIFFMLSVTAKVLSVFAVVFLVFFEAHSHAKMNAFSAKNKWMIYLRACFALAIISAPFLYWLIILQIKQIPSPFHFNNGIENRHSGSLALLLDLHYFLRINTWLWVKGTGLATSVVFISRIFKLKKRWANLAKEERLLWIWLAGIIPYVVLVRDGNFVHDNYLLPFLPPICLLAAMQVREWLDGPWLLFLPERPMSAGVRQFIIYSLLIMTLLIGVDALVSLKVVETDPRLGRPSFCDMEKVDH